MGLFRMKSTGQLVRSYSFGEKDGRVTMTVRVHPEDNPGRAMTFVAEVFGIDPDDLEEIT